MKSKAVVRPSHTARQGKVKMNLADKVYNINYILFNLVCQEYFENIL
jgi:hypothetical protein